MAIYAKIHDRGNLGLVRKPKVLRGFILKRHSNLYNKIISKENIELAYQKAKKGKTWQQKIQLISKDKEKYLEKLCIQLKNKKYTTSPYTIKTIYIPKTRKIYVLPFYPDRIVQHAIMNVLSPIWDKLFIEDSYACRIGKGQHKGSLRCMQFVRRNKYCLQCDISKFYPSINHKKLIAIIKRKIKCKDTIDLLKEIIESIPGQNNVPIGNYTSQWFGNLYMNEMDLLMKHKYKIRDYIRYCDDFLLFSNDKEKLKKMADIITNFTQNELKMRLSKCNLYHTSQGVDFLGYRHFPNGKILLRKSTAKRVKKNIKSLPYKIRHGKIALTGALSTLASIKGWIKWANTYNLKTSLQIDKLESEVKNGKICRLCR